MKIISKYFLLILLVWLPAAMFGQQVNIIQQATNSRMLSPSDCFELLVTNSDNAQTVYFNVIVSGENDEILVTLKSTPILILSGVQRVDKTMVQIAESEYRSTSIQRSVLSTGYFPGGNYTFCIEAIRLQDESVVGSGCSRVIVFSGIGAESDTTVGKAIDWYGNASIEGVYANAQGLNQELPPSYARLDFNPAVSAWQVPVMANVHLTTEASEQYPDLNTYSVRFDKATFRQRLQDMVMAELLESQAAKLKQHAQIAAQLKELDQIEQVLQDKSLQLELAAKDSLEARIQLIEQDTSLQIQEKKEILHDLQSKYNTLLAKKNQIDRLIAQKDKIVQMKEKWESSGLLAEMDGFATSAPNLNDPMVLENSLRQYGLYAGTNKILMHVEEIAVGTVYPVYSPFTLSGVQINGGRIEWNPGAIFIGASGGKLNSAVYNNGSPSESAYETNVIAGRLGLGNLNSSHLSITAVRFTDDSTSLQLPVGIKRYPTQQTLSSLLLRIKPANNQVFELSGELAGLIANDNLLERESIQSIVPEAPQTPGFLNINLRTHADFAWNLRSVVNFSRTGTKLIANGRFVGPGFVTPGAPGLRNDVRYYEGRIEQSVFSNQLRVSGMYRQEEDNFSNAKGLRTYRDLFTGEMQIRLDGWPQVKCSYTKNLQENEGYSYAADVINGFVNYQYAVFGLKSSIQFNYLHFQNAIDSISGQNFTSNYYLLNHMSSFGNGYAVTVSGQVSTAIFDDFSTDTYLGGLALTASIMQKVQMTIGGTYSADDIIENKLGGSLQLLYPVTTWLRLQFSGNYNRFENLPNGDTVFRENFMHLKVIAVW